MTKALTDPRAHLVLHIAWQSLAEATHEFHPTGHGNVSAQLKSDLYIVGIRLRLLRLPQPHVQTCDTLHRKSSFNSRML